MSRWKELPETVDDHFRQLVAHLRRLKDESGLSLAALAARTTYSKSSWERYLNGKTLPPGRAVADLARAADADPAPALSLHAAAEAARDQHATAAVRDGPEAAAGASVEPVPVAAARTVSAAGLPAAPRRRRLRRRPALVALGAVALACGGLLAFAPWQSDPPRDPRISAHDGETYTADGRRDHPCRIHHYEGRLYAGHSPTVEALLGYGSNGWEVAEVQCLLREAGFAPGRVDGIYGDKTIRAVRDLQEEAGLVRDGEVGPDTWKALRRVTPQSSTA